jgi:hypothetical protein
LEELKGTVMAHIKAAYRRKNNGSIINRLPAEIILMIIDFATLLVPEDTKARGLINNPIFQFNGRFRDVALGAPSIWSRVYAKSVSEAEELLARSKDCGIHVWEPKTEVLAYLLGFRERWRSFELTHWSSNAFYNDLYDDFSDFSDSSAYEPPGRPSRTVLESIFFLPMAELEQFRIRSKRMPAPRALTSETSITQDHLFQGIAPKLKVLSLPWLLRPKDPIWCQLEEIEITAGGTIVCDDLFEALQVCNSLKTLALLSCNFAFGKKPYSKRYPKLPALQTLKINTPYDHGMSSQSLSHFVMSRPSSVYIMIETSIFPNVPTLEERICPSNNPFETPHFVTATTCMKLSFLAEGLRMFEVSSAERGSLKLKFSTAWAYQIDLHLGDVEAVDFRSLALKGVKKISETCTSVVQELLLDHAPSLPFVLEIIHHLAMLTTLTLQNFNHTSGLLIRLSTQEPESLLPHLTSLTIKNEDCKMTYPGILLRCLRKRSNGPWARLKRLQIPLELEQEDFLEKIAAFTDVLVYERAKLVLDRLPARKLEVISHIY